MGRLYVSRCWVTGLEALANCTPDDRGGQDCQPPTSSSIAMIYFFTALCKVRGIKIRTFSLMLKLIPYKKLLTRNFFVLKCGVYLNSSMNLDS